MSDVDGTCEYVLDPDDPETWGGEEGDECKVRDEVLDSNGIWSCPRDSKKGGKLCIFHTQVGEKSNKQVENAFETIINDISNNRDSEEASLRLLGSEIGKFAPNKNIFNGDIEKYEVDFTHATFHDTLKWPANTDTPDIYFRAATFSDVARFAGVEFKQAADFRHSEFKKEGLW